MTRPVYRHLAAGLLRRCRALPLAGFQRLGDLSTDQLIHLVNKAARLERGWLTRTPRPARSSLYSPLLNSPSSSPSKGKGKAKANSADDSDIRLDDDGNRDWYKIVSTPPDEEVDWLSPITACYTLCATKSGKVVCWDVQKDEGLAQWNPGERWELWKCRVEFDERSVFFTMARVLGGT